jgi:hypothetical protein
VRLAAALPAALLYAVARGVDSLCGFQALYHDSPSLLSSPLAFGTVLGALVFISPIFLNAVGRSRALFLDEFPLPVGRRERRVA